ncbi:hypothetical protein ABEY96_28270 [Priestia aryabhattai]|uniref:hypothetical protein n=1 Tax=Priestia aryabhattai TaxID=412384 RepID=UPI003D2A02A3
MTRKIFRGTIEYNLDKTPKIHAIGDFATINGNLTMILEIESFLLEEKSSLLIVTYIVQDMNKPVLPEELIPHTYMGTYEHTIFTSLYDKDDVTINNLKVGNTYNHQGYVYKVLEYTHLELVGKELSVGFTVKPISPVLPSKLKQKRLQYKREQVNFVVMDNTSKRQRT